MTPVTIICDYPMRLFVLFVCFMFVLKNIYRVRWEHSECVVTFIEELLV